MAPRTDANAIDAPSRRDLGDYGLRCTAASGVTTRKLKLSSR
jgi:hypothetical protein